ncbi:histidinol-phosphate transaminase [Luteimonas sp. 22616]|uniref:histidinol-phosphate transaminase n=1 Tax=Luteimonas sp. 22616 TaxID=3453951 RepID=UPI003F86AF8C
MMGNRESEIGKAGEAWAEALAMPAVRGLRAYDPGHDLVALRRRFAPGGLVELGSNENPYGPSPRAREAAAVALDELHRYPDPLGGDLKRALAAKHDVDAAQIILGNGSHELLMQLAQVFAGPGVDVVMSQFGFAVYAIATQAVGANLRVAPALPCEAGMPRGHDLDAIAAAITPATRLVYLANPNNPTGTWFAHDAFAAFLARVPGDTLVVVDEAYAEIADAPDFGSALPLLAAHRNLVVTRTFSKAYALAGLRVGYAIAHPDVIALLERVRESFNVNAVALAAAGAALGDDDWLRDTLAANATQRAALAAGLRERGWRVSPSQTNFLLVEFGGHTARIEQGLLERGVVLRPMGGYGLPQCSRISVGNAAENRALLAALDEFASDSGLVATDEHGVAR